MHRENGVVCVCVCACTHVGMHTGEGVGRLSGKTWNLGGDKYKTLV